MLYLPSIPNPITLPVNENIPTNTESLLYRIKNVGNFSTYGVH